MAKKKKPFIPDHARLTQIHEARVTLEKIRKLTIDLNKLDAARQADHLKIDAKCAAEMEEIDAERNYLVCLLNRWADENKSVFGTAKSLTWMHGTFGWRMGMHKLVKKTKTKWEDLVDIVKEKLGATFIRTKEEVDREAIIAAAKDSRITPEQLAATGLEVAQDDGFYVEPKLDELAV
jgi:phage host-nuclease inhibitor protein Gam